MEKDKNKCKMHKGRGVVSRDVLDDTAIGVGDLATKKRSVGLV